LVSVIVQVCVGEVAEIGFGVTVREKIAFGSANFSNGFVGKGISVLLSHPNISIIRNRDNLFISNTLSSLLKME